MDNASQLAYPCVVPRHKWYQELLRPKDQMRSGFSLIADRNRMILDLTDVPADDREVYDDFACTHIVKTIRRVKDTCDFMYAVALCFRGDT